MATFAQSLRHKVSIQQPSMSRDAAGQRVDGWAELRKAWADIRHTGGLEAIRASAVVGKVSASIRVRYCDDIDGSMRIVHGSKVYKVTAVLPDGARAHVDLVCEVIK